MRNPQHVYSRQFITICILRQTASRSYGVAQVLGNNYWPPKFLLFLPSFSPVLPFSPSLIYITEYYKNWLVGRASKSIDFALCCILDSLQVSWCVLVYFVLMWKVKLTSFMCVMSTFMSIANSGG
jgi:hypothetical protein